MPEIQGLLTETEIITAHGGGCHSSRLDEGDPLPLQGKNIPELAATHHTSNLKNRDRIAASGSYETLKSVFPEIREDLQIMGLDESSGYFTPYLFGPLLPIYNNSVKSPPSSWQDLLDERWQGKIVVADSNVHFNLLKANLRPIVRERLEPFLDSLVYRGNPVNVNYEVDAGNMDIGITALPFAKSSRKGNVSFCWPQEGAFCIPQVLIFKKGVHKDAMAVGRYLLSDKVQRLASGAGLIPVNPNVPLPEQVVENSLNLYWMGWDQFVQALNKN
jgi:ABC-type Fe3+ transport system substrate-binding protein